MPFDHCLLQVFLVFITIFYGGQVCAQLEVTVEASKGCVATFQSALYHCAIGIVEHIAGFAYAIQVYICIEGDRYAVSEISGQIVIAEACVGRQTFQRAILVIIFFYEFKYSVQQIFAVALFGYVFCCVVKFSA